MSLGTGQRVMFPDGREGEIVWAGGSYDCREYKLKMGKQISHFTHDELLNQLFQQRDQGIYRFNQTVDSQRR